MSAVQHAAHSVFGGALPVYLPHAIVAAVAGSVMSNRKHFVTNLNFAFWQKAPFVAKIHHIMLIKALTGYP